MQNQSNWEITFDTQLKNALILIEIAINILSLRSKECHNYKSLKGAGRKVTHKATRWLCDRGLSKSWYRFKGPAGSKMAYSCPTSVNLCDTTVPGWLKGPDPRVEDGVVRRQVCFRYNKCCETKTTIKVRNCGSYFVYLLNGTPNDQSPM